MNSLNGIETKTLVRIVKTLDGYEMWYRIEERGVYEIVHHARNHKREVKA